ncbi:pentapeptide repeat-containing protein [Cohnella sp. 56]|uniref:pentapeptide repeat-containing protein n=1 Tax=Cohnella sp. 56 TaxID=3113722 RepID=UPI0030E8ED50
MIVIQTLASEAPIIINATSLVNLSLEGIDFHRAILSNREMMNCILRKANLRNADLMALNCMMLILKAHCYWKQHLIIRQYGLKIFSPCSAVRFGQLTIKFTCGVTEQLGMVA